MKKLLILLGLVACLSLSSCDETARSEVLDSKNMFVVIYNDGHAIVYVDKETGVQYFSRSNSGTCVVVNEDGNPLIYDLED